MEAPRDRKLFSMADYEVFRKLVGAPWTGLSFHSAPRSIEETPSACARLCEAVGRSFHGAMTIDTTMLECPGGMRALGIPIDDEYMACEMAGRFRMPIEHARHIIQATSRLERPPRFISMGLIEQPDVLVSYLPPESAMKLLRRWQQFFGRRLETDLSASTAVCAAAAEAHVATKMAFSFGCPDSRDYGGIEDHQLITATSRYVAARLVQGTADDALP